mmetsp:Transcript_62462/g.122913  ORF Transcript_62462/g.122913 Transcript_62462/m.122913 type:complete len:121 (-) Transcript_62462:39-401(-)
MSSNPTDSGGILEEARQINSSLRRVGQQVRVSVNLAGSASQTLEQDGTTIEKALNEHKYEMKNALSSTSRRLTRIKNAATYEKIYMWSSVAFLTAVVIYIVLRRFRILALIWYNIRCRML